LKTNTIFDIKTLSIKRGEKLSLKDLNVLQIGKSYYYITDRRTT